MPVPVPVGARGIGRCRRGVAGASGPLPVPSRSPPDPAAQVSTAPGTAPSRPDGRRSRPARTRDPGVPGTPYARYPGTPRGTAVVLLPRPLLLWYPRYCFSPRYPQHPWCSARPGYPRLLVPLIFPATEPPGFPRLSRPGLWEQRVLMGDRSQEYPRVSPRHSPTGPGSAGGANIVPRDPPGRKGPSGCCRPRLPPYPSLPKHCTAGGDPMEKDPQGSPVPSAIPRLSGADPGASGRPPQLGVLPGPEAAVPTHASTHGHLRGLGWQPGGCRVPAAQARRDLAPGMPNATSVTPWRRDWRSVPCPCPSAALLDKDTLGGARALPLHG